MGIIIDSRWNITTQEVDLSLTVAFDLLYYL